MLNFQIYDETNAPKDAQSVLSQVKEKYGFIPNLLGGLAESPPALQGYLDLNERIVQTTLSSQEQQIVFLAVSFENECHYCMAAHSALAKMNELDESTLEALRSGEELPDEKQNALAQFARKLVRQRGWLEEGDCRQLIDAGYTRANVLDVFLINAAKTLSNYVNHLMDTPVDESFAEFTWDKQEA